MAHNIEAMITQDPIDEAVANSFDLPVFRRGNSSIIALHPNHSDHWSSKLDMPYVASGDIICDCPVIHHMANQLGLKSYAIIRTEYFGGMGEQYATLYSNGNQLIPETENAINLILAALGVVKDKEKDEFDSIGLGDFRNFDGCFESYNY
ncbi:hypothetical protein [Marinicella meishanensis]|uniref:hypothetical protein n=1 Tax=Marinicella meishanensis TaxID=2873263 RepID=UPI001CC177C1|nr:hypothetical protein [Marinicella sp. NBU2979]